MLSTCHKILQGRSILELLQLVSILLYRFILWVHGSIQMWPQCRLEIEYC